LPGSGSNNGYSSASVLKSSLNGGSLTTKLTSKRVSVITSELGPTENTTVPLLLKWFAWERVLFAKALPSNGSGRYDILMVTNVEAMRNFEVIPDVFNVVEIRTVPV
jgi:hypothetical protein